jgi:hypothetical protein
MAQEMPVLLASMHKSHEAVFSGPDVLSPLNFRYRANGTVCSPGGMLGRVLLACTTGCWLARAGPLSLVEPPTARGSVAVASENSAAWSPLRDRKPGEWGGGQPQAR